MGGNIWTQSSRINKADYQKLVDLFETSNTLRVIASYHNKDSFGDLDLISLDASEEIQFLSAHFQVHSTSKNGNVVSYLVELDNDVLFQIDCIRKSVLNAEFAWRYYSWNDCGNLMGRIARRLGLKLTDQGLYYLHYDVKVHLKDQLLTTDFDEALDVLGFDHKRHALGFSSPEDIYAFIADSVHFQVDFYLLENLNNQNRTRDRKRQMYMGFLSWLEMNGYKPSTTLQPEVQKPTLEQLFVRFPEFRNDYEQTQQFYETQKLIKEKFNGNIVMKITGLAGADLGKFIQKCKSEPWYDNILELTGDMVENLINETWIKYQVEF